MVKYRRKDFVDKCRKAGMKELYRLADEQHRKIVLIEAYLRGEPSFGGKKDRQKYPDKKGEWTLGNMKEEKKRLAIIKTFISVKSRASDR